MAVSDAARRGSTRMTSRHRAAQADGLVRELEAGILAQEKQHDINGVADPVDDDGDREVATTYQIYESQNQAVGTLLDNSRKALAVMREAE